MKRNKAIAILMMCAMLISLTACVPAYKEENTVESATEQNISDKTSLPEFTPIEDAVVLEQLNRDYIVPMSFCKPPEWETASDIYPDDFAVFYLVKAKPEPKSKTEDGLPNYPQDEVEAFVQKYFDVDTDLMRSAQMYDAELGVYHTWGIGSAWESRVVGASEVGDYLQIDYEIFAELHSGITNVTHGYGTVLMQKNPDNNNEYKFISYKYHKLPIPESTVIGESY